LRNLAFIADLRALKRRRNAPFVRTVSKPSLEHLELIFGSEFPTERAPERAALAARRVAQAVSDAAELVALTEVTELREVTEGGAWCDSEAPTSVAAERPLLPRPPRSPNL
jgi:hypothetical protein